MVLVFDRHQEVTDWVCAQAGNVPPVASSAMGVEVDGHLVAGIYFDSLTQNNVFGHLAFTKALPLDGRLALMRACAVYVYQQLGLERATLAFPADHRGVLGLAEFSGAQYEGRLRRAFGDVDMLLYVLWRDAPFIQTLLGDK